MAKLDPLEEKILFDTEGSGRSRSLSKLGSISTEEIAGTPGNTDFISRFSSVQSGSLSTLMRSAVVEASTNDSGVQEEFSGLSFQNTVPFTNNQPSNLFTHEQQHAKWSGTKSCSSSYSLRAPPSSCDMTLNSPFPISPQKGLQLTLELRMNKYSPHVNSEQCPVLSQFSDSHQQTKQSPIGHLANSCLNNQNLKSNTQAQNISLHESCWMADVLQGSRSSCTSVSDVPRRRDLISSDFMDETNPRTHLVKHATVDQKENKILGPDFHKLCNSLTDVDSPKKNAAQMHGIQNCYQGENSSDIFNYKDSEAYITHPNQACLIAEYSESFAKSCQKKPNQGEQNMLADALPKGNPTSDITASLDSQCTSEHDKVNQHKVEAILGNGRKEITWWRPSSFGSSIPTLQGASGFQDWRGKFNILTNSGFKAANWNSEGASDKAVVPHVKHQMEHKGLPSVAFAYESSKNNCPEMGQPLHRAGSSQDSYLLKNLTTSGLVHSTSEALPFAESFISGTCQQGMEPPKLGMSMSSQREAMAASKISSDVYLPGFFSHGALQSSLVSQSSWNPQIISGGVKQLGKERSHEFKSPMIEAGGIHVSSGNSPTLSGESSIFLTGSMNLLEHIKTEQTDQCSTGTSSNALQPCDRPQRSHAYVDGINEEFDSSFSTSILDSDMKKVAFNSTSALFNLSVQRDLDVFGQPQPREKHMLASNPIGRQLNAESQFGPHSPKVPVFVESNPHGPPTGNNMVYDRIRNPNIGAQLLPADCKQHEYIQNGHTLFRTETALGISRKASETFQLGATHVSALDRREDCDILPCPSNQIVANGKLSSASVLPPVPGNVNQALKNPKKRKKAMYDCLPWHKEIQSCQDLQEIRGFTIWSRADEEWLDVTNQLIETRVDGNDRHLEMQPALRAKKRLILSTLLIQQIFQPPTLSVHVSEYEIMVYSVAKVALVDACHLTNKQRTDCHIPRVNGAIDIPKPRNARSRGYLHLVNTAEELGERVKKLEFHLDGLGSSLSIVDVRKECQQLDKLNVVNQFAKYHRKKKQLPTTDSASSSTAMASSRPFLQRYVTALPLPPKLPKGSKCFSL